MVLAVSHEATTCFFLYESIYPSMNLGTGHHLRCRLCHYDTFHKVHGVLHEWMVGREELTMFVERRILATLLEPNKP
jgi:hypothetical protein